MMRAFVIAAIVIASIGFCNTQCVLHEREALFELKRSFIDDYGILASWDDDLDCCSWSGVVCNNFTGHVLQLHLQGFDSDDSGNGYLKLSGDIDESLLELKHLRYLDLSRNNFVGISIPEFFGFMSSLRFLNLSAAGFGGNIPSSIGNLAFLVTLDLSINSFAGEIPRELGNLSSLQYLSIRPDLFHPMKSEKLDWISRLPSLKFLEFSNVHCSKSSEWANSLSKLPSLQHLRLSNCQLTRIPPLLNLSFPSLTYLDLSFNYLLAPFSFATSIASLQNLTSLRSLDLSDNLFNSSIPDHWFKGFTQLELLDLRFNELDGFIPSSIGNLTSLITLDLSENNFVGKIPNSFISLCNLRLLSLSSNRMSQEVNEAISILSYCALDKLESLHLPNSRFSGYLSDVLNKFKSLVSVDLSNNSIVGPLPLSFGEMASLTYLDLSHNKLNGSFPSIFGRLESLVHLDVSFNLLVGEVSEIHFQSLRNLLLFEASENHLILKVNPDWIPPFQLVEILYLSSCEVGPHFPNWLRHLKYLKGLDFSKSNIHSQLPAWIFNFSSSLFELELRNNQIYGMIPNLSLTTQYTDLSSNLLQGPLPHVHNTLTWIDLSNNLLSGSMHNFLCNNHDSEGYFTQVVILKENQLNGEISVDCWMNWTNVMVLDLSNNNFSGNIPTSIGLLTFLQMLSLHNNSFTGDIPSTIQNCTHLIALDLGENELRGEVPSWIGEHLKELKILNIRGNKFHGHMSKELCNMPILQILDFANNNLSGPIPACVGNLMGMSRTISTPISIFVAFFNWEEAVIAKDYTANSMIVRKGKLVEYNTTLAYVQSLDVSNNNFVGDVPEGITNLSGLQCLNLSYNFFTGRISKDIDAMRKLESLDLSNNLLSGEIPQSMSNMNFLSNLNLSNNNLSGKIPTGTQLQSMDPSSFMGNKLCGPPLTKDCNNKEATPPSNAKGREEDHDEKAEAVDWFYIYVSLAAGFVVGFWCFVGPLAFNVQWRRAYFNFLDLWWDKIWVWYHVNVVRFVRNYGL